MSLAETPADAPITETAASSPGPPPPARPPGLPAGAIWSADDHEWRLLETDGAGALHGTQRAWRTDGTLRSVAEFRHGRADGLSWRFHPDGSVYGVGRFVGGAAHGVSRLYASDGPNPEMLQPCCVPPGAWQLRIEHDRGSLVGRRWYDRGGVHILPGSGRPFPPRPPSVPARALYDEDAACWEDGLVYEEAGLRGTRRRWSVDGTLRLSEDLLRGVRHGAFRAFDSNGALAVEARYDEGKLSGPYRALALPPEHYAYAEAGGGGDDIRCEEGTFAGDQAVGTWRLGDGAGRTLVERDLGAAIDERALPDSPALDDEPRAAEAWRASAGALRAEGRVAEALLCAARATAVAGSAEDLRATLAALALPLGAATARAAAAATVERADGKLAPLVDGLRRGQDPVTLLRALAASLPGRDRAARDLATAALLADPSRSEAALTRALIHAALGDPEAAHADLGRLAADAPEQAAEVAMFLRVHFPRFDFWPARVDVGDGGADDGADGEPPLAPARSPEEIREVIQRYASRLGRLRAALLTRVGPGAPFVVPDLAALLPEGPLPLRRWTFTMTTDEYSGQDGESEAGDSAGAEDGDLVEIAVDEVGDLDAFAVSGSIAGSVTASAAGPPVPILALMRRARSDWVGLTWLCWAAGLDAVGLPDAVAPPANFAAAATAMVARTWRCRDRVNTTGLLALTKGIPGFDWEGTPIDLVPAILIDLAIEEHVEALAVFSWLCDPQNRSPWQEDLRTAG